MSGKKSKQPTNYSFRQMKGLTSTSKIVIFSLGSFVIGAIVFLFLRNNGSIVAQSPGTIRKPFGLNDRSESYEVKVIPADLDDIALHELSTKEPNAFSYLAMIDAGSSGCRAHIYRYGKLGSIEGPLYILPQHNSKKVKPGLSSFASNPSDAGMSLKGLIDFMKEQVPEKAWPVTPIWLKATAGLRMIDKSKSDAILSSVRSFLGDRSNSPFLFRESYAGIISGNEEGGFGWIAFNYLKKVIGPKKIQNAVPYAVVEMGGASSQVSQVAPTKEDAEAIPIEHRFSFSIEGETFHLYTHSYLGYGAEQGREALNLLLMKNLEATGAATATIGTGTTTVGSSEVKDPCLYAGYTRDGSISPRKEVYEGIAGNMIVSGIATKEGSCAASLKDLFPKDTCPKEARPVSVSFGCTFQPKFVVESQNFLVFENFFYVSSATGVLPQNHALDAKPMAVFPLLTTPLEYQEAAEAVCGLDWTAVQSTYPLDSQGKENNIKWCYAASYASVFLIDGLGLPKDKQLTVQKEVDGSEIEWALGAAYKEASDFLRRTNLRPQ